MGRQEEGNFQWGSYCWVHNTTFADHADFIKHLEQVSHVPADAPVGISLMENEPRKVNGKANR